jgi:AcrR family transcriptional regulator
MSSPRTSAGTPERTLALLWRRRLPQHRSARGPRQRLSVDAIVQAAVAVADTEGLDAITIRRVATAMGTSPMTLYTYIPGKAELLDLMLDDAYARIPRPPLAGLRGQTGPTGPAWRERVQAVAEQNRTLFETHPWAALVATTRPPLGPGAMAKYDYELGAFDGLGLDEVTMDAALAWTLAFVQGWSRAAAAAEAAQRESGLDDQQWWDVAGPLLSELVGTQEFPLAARVGAAAGHAHGAAWDPRRAYEFGLQRVLDGLAALIPPSGSR